MAQIKDVIKRLLAMTPYRISRAGLQNRFQAIDDVLRNLLRRGFTPDVIIDGGANVGDFARLCHARWPSAEVHVIEPQMSCKPYLDALPKTGAFKVHITALGDRPGHLLLAADPRTTSTGAHVVLDPPPSDGSHIQVPMETLDRLTEGAFDGGKRGFLKLDLQGYELQALRGGENVIASTDVALIEVSFFAQAYEPPIIDLITFFHDRGFDLHDVASVTGRARDQRARQGDFVFARRTCALASDTSWS